MSRSKKLPRYEFMYERFTDRARKVMQLANQEAQRFNHEYIGTEHILLGLVKEGSGVAANVLKNLDVDLRTIRLEVEKIVESGPDMVTLGKLPQTPRAKKVIEYSMEEARNVNHNYVGTEHILLGLLREQEGVAAQVLMNLGLQIADIREEILNLLGPGMETSGYKRPRSHQRRFGSPLSKGVCQVLDLAEEEARRLNHDNLCTVHLLLGIVRHWESTEFDLLRKHEVTAEAVRDQLKGLVLEFPPWDDRREPALTRQFTEAIRAAARDAKSRSPQAKLDEKIEQLEIEKKQALADQHYERAAKVRDEILKLREAARREPWEVGPAHLLLGILGCPDSAASRILENLGLHPEPLREELNRRLGETSS